MSLARWEKTLAQYKSTSLHSDKGRPQAGNTFPTETRWFLPGNGWVVDPTPRLTPWFEPERESINVARNTLRSVRALRSKARASGTPCYGNEGTRDRGWV